MHDLKYAAARLDITYRGLSDNIQSSGLVSTARAFESNIDRVRSLLEIPFVSARHFSQFMFAVQLTEERRSEDNEKEWSKILQNLTDTYNLISSDLEVFNKWNKFVSDIDPMLLKSESGTGIIGHESLLSAAILGTWTAFETLAGDIWEEAMNLRPETLIKSMAKPDREGQPTLAIKVGTNKLKEFAENLTNSRFGVIFKNEYQFNNYDRVCNAYKIGFGKIFDSLDTGNDRSLFNLAKTRNAIVHRAGKVDGEFFAAMVDVDSPVSQFAGLTKGNPIPIDGEVVQNLVGNAIRSSVRLINDVDTWVAGAPKK